MKLFATAVAREDEVESDLPVGWNLEGRREVLKGAVVKLHGPRHATGSEGNTLCGIPSGELVFLGTGFAPERTGACPLCQVELERLGDELGPIRFWAPPPELGAPQGTWMAEWEVVMKREWERVWARREEEPGTMGLLLALNYFCSVDADRAATEEILRSAADTLGDDRLDDIVDHYMQEDSIEYLARAAMAEFVRLTTR